MSAETKNDENFVIFHDATITNQFYQSFYASAQLLGLTIPSCSSITNVSDINYQSPKLFPNPVTNNFNIETSDSYIWIIKNNLGQVVKKGTQSNTDIHELKNGLYLLQVTMNHQILITV